jgi:hypothetical protein
MLRALVVAAALVGCSPYGGGAFTCTQDSQCSGGGQCVNSFCAFSDGQCPSGLRYGELSGPNSNVCVGQEMPDAGTPMDSDAGSDSGMGSDAGMGSNACYGAGPGKVCFAQPPTGTQTINAAINTDGAMCATTVIGTAPGCVIAADSITISGTVTVTGSKALVLVAATTLTVTGSLDASSRRGGGGQLGASADPAGCDPGTAPGAHGGGAGGSFGGTGGAGGNDGGGMHGGVAGAAQATLTALRGGCPGQTGAVGGTAGAPGHGGGAVYLIAGTSIVIASGTINASGEPGTGGSTMGAGGGGAGAGGLVAFDAPSVTNNASVFANGGGGGEGAGTNSTGNTPADPTAGAAPGGAGATTSGGDGGPGAFGATANGTAGLPATTMGGGGGGGGGAGLIKLYQAQTIGGSGTTSPPPT